MITSEIIAIFLSVAPATTSPTGISATTVSPCISSFSTSYMSSYNVITLEDLKTTSDVENRTIVCGSLLATQANFAIHLNNGNISPASYSLAINGATTAGNSINVNGGSVALGPTRPNRIVKNGNIQYKVDDQIQFNINQGNEGATIKIDDTLPQICAEIKSSIQSLSQTLAQLPSNNNATFPSSQPGPLNFYANNVDANGVVVFNLPGSSVFNDKNNIQQIEFFPQNKNIQLVVFNLFGTTINWAGGNLVGSWFDSISLGRAHTIWNFPEATTINFNGNMKGAVLAPYATLVTRINIDGAVAVKSLDTSGEVHDPPIVFPKCIPTPTQSTTSEQDNTIALLPVSLDSFIRFKVHRRSLQLQSVSDQMCIWLHSAATFNRLASFTTPFVTTTKGQPTSTGTGPTTSGALGTSVAPPTTTRLPTGSSASLISK